MLSEQDRKAALEAYIEHFGMPTEMLDRLDPAHKHNWLRAYELGMQAAHREREDERELVFSALRSRFQHTAHPGLVEIIIQDVREEMFKHRQLAKGDE